MPAAASLRALLERSIDYAGIFPPCSLVLEHALKNQAQYIRSADAWILGVFVLPIAEFDAAKQWLVQFSPQHPLRVSALGPKTDNAVAFEQSLEKTAESIRSLSAHNVDLISIRQLAPLGTARPRRDRPGRRSNRFRVVDDRRQARHPGGRSGFA